MQVLSIHSKLKILLEAGTISLKANPDLGHVFPGEGSYFFDDDKVEIISNYTGLVPDNSDVRLTEPHDMAWVPRTKTVLAYAPSDTGPFELMPTTLRNRVAAFKKKTATLIN